MSGPATTLDSLFDHCWDLRLLVEGCRRLADDVLEELRIPDPLAHKVEILSAFLKATERQAIVVFDICDKATNAESEAAARA